MTVISSTQGRPRLDAVEADGPHALRGLRRALSDLLSSIGPLARAVHLGEALKLDRSLAWKVWRVAQGPDELPSPKHVPGRAGMATFLKAAEQHGVARKKVEAVRQAHAVLEEIFREHAGDRASAEILFGRLTDEGRSRLEMELRRDAFRANSHFLGVRMRTRHTIDLIAPSRAPGCMPEQSRIRGYYGLQRTRADARWVLSRSKVLREGKPVEGYKRTPFGGAPAPDDAASAIPIAPEFCSLRNLPLHRAMAHDQTFVDELGPGPVGEGGAANIVTAETISEIPGQDLREDTLGVTVRTPSERLCYELFMHRGFVRQTEPRLDVFTSLNGTTTRDVPDPRDVVPILETMKSLGSAEGAPPAVEVPRHSDLTAWMFERLGYSPEDFVAYRFTMRYPPIPILVWVTYPIPGQIRG